VPKKTKKATKKKAKRKAKRRTASAATTETQAAIRERRWKAWQMRVVQKLRVSSIAEVLGVSERTIESDLEAMRKLRTDDIRHMKKAAEGAMAAAVEVIEEYDATCRQAWADLLAAAPGTATRAKFLSVLNAAVGQRVKILQSLGALEKSPDELLLGRDLDAVHELTDTEAALLLDLLAAARAHQPGA